MKLRVVTALVVVVSSVLSAVAVGAPASAEDGKVAVAGPAQQRASYAIIEGTGSTWSQIIVDQWIADVEKSGIPVVYSGGGSTKGRKDFSLSTNDFAISEIPYQGRDEDGNADTSNGRDFAYLPIVAGGTAFTYQLRIGNQQVKNLRLSGETIAKIFTNQITDWNDDAITADNNGREFPSIPITPVVRSDGSGTTAQFTTWLDKQYPSIWRPFFGKSGLTSYYPRKGRALGQAGSDQVMSTIKAESGNGTIGYVEYSFPRNAGYPVVKVLNKGGFYVEPTDYNVAVALTKARINTTDKNDPSKYLTQILDGVYANPDPRSYPVSSYSYMIIPTAADDGEMTTAKRQSLADFMYYSLCGGQTKAGNLGYSPLPLNLVQAGITQLAKLKAADPDVTITNRDVKNCGNPTFDGSNPNRNKLAVDAPQPAACDKQGAGPCGTDTGTGQPSTDEGDPATDGGTDQPASGGPTGGGGNDTGGGTGTDTGGTPGVTGPPGGGAEPVVDPETGAVVGSTDTSGGTTDPIYANSTLVEDRALDTRTFAWAALVLLLALVLVPGLMTSSMRRRRREGTRA